MPTHDSHNTQVLHVTTADQTFRRLDLLKRSQPTRRRLGEFFVEGVKSIDRARAARWPIHSLVYTAGRPPTPWARDTLATTPSAQHIALHPSLMARLSDKHNPSELIAIVAMPPDTPDRIKPTRNTLLVTLDHPSSPGNLGSVIRSCHAFGADGLIVTGHGTDIYNPLTIRASMGSLFALPTVRLPSHREVARWVGDVATGTAAGAGIGVGVGVGNHPTRPKHTQREGSSHRIQIVGTSRDATLPADAVDLTTPTMLVFGNEAHGLSAVYRELCDLVVRIPMHRDADSINVACAAAVLLYEVDRQRRSRRARGSRPQRRTQRDPDP